MNVTARITFPASLLPAPFDIFETRKWGDPAVLNGNYSTKLRLVDGVEYGQFSFFGVYCEDTRSFDAQDNTNRLTHADMMRIANMQLYSWDTLRYPLGMSDVAIREVRKITLDGYTLDQKMGWLYNDLNENPKPNSALWGVGPWDVADGVKYGCQVWAGNAVKCSLQTYTVVAQYPADKVNVSITLRELVPFRRADFAKPARLYPHLWNVCTVANKNDVFGNAPRGTIYCPVALDWREFGGSVSPARYGFPAEWLK